MDAECDEMSEEMEEHEAKLHKTIWSNDEVFPFVESPKEKARPVGGMWAVVVIIWGGGGGGVGGRHGATGGA